MMKNSTIFVFSLFFLLYMNLCFISLWLKSALASLFSSNNQILFPTHVGKFYHENFIRLAKTLIPIKIQMLREEFHLLHPAVLGGTFGGEVKL